MSDIEVVPYGPPYEQAHTAFATKCWPAKRRRRDAAYTRWKFRGPAQGPVPGLLLAVSDGQVLGQAGLLPGKAQIGNRTVDIQWVCDLMVDPDQRRRGITSMIFDEALGRGMVTVTSDPSEASKRSFSSKGFVQSDSSWLMVLTLRAGPVVTTRYPQARPLSRAVDVLASPAIAWTNRRLRAALAAPDAVVCSWQDVVDLVVATEASLVAPHAIHDADFLAWRCSGLDGWVRELEAIRTPAGSFAIVERSGAYLALHEWYAATDEDLARLLARVAYVAQSYGFPYVQTFAIDLNAKSRLERLGFRPRRHRVDFWIHPGDELDTAMGSWAFWGYDSDYQL